MNEHLGNFMKEFGRWYDYVEELKTTNSDIIVFIRISKNTI